MALTNKLTAIADAIREKTETTDLLKLDDMPTAISNIEAGGGKYKPRYLYQPISFRNYKGTELDHETQMLDTTNFTDMNYMFGSCSNLTHLDLSGWNTSNVTNMSYMFNSCSNLTHLDLSSFDTSNVTDMSNMFYGSAMLTKLDIRNFTFDKVTSNNVMFSSVPSNCLIIVKGETEKQWVLARRSQLTNVKTVAELEV